MKLNLKVMTKSAIGIIMAVILLIVAITLLSKPDHGYDVSSEHTVSIEDYTHCVNLMLVEESSVSSQRLKTLILGCNNIIHDHPSWIRNQEGDYLIFVNDDDYYRMSPLLIKRITKQIERIKAEHLDWFERANES